jgi:hypothetical protein
MKGCMGYHNYCLTQHKDARWGGDTMKGSTAHYKVCNQEHFHYDITALRLLLDPPGGGGRNVIWVLGPHKFRHTQSVLDSARLTTSDEKLSKVRGPA